MIAAGREPDKLPVTGDILGDLRDREILDEDAEQLLVKMVGETQFAAAPNRFNPGFGYEEQHRLAAAGRLVKTPLPSLARGDPAVWIEVEENLIFPALALEPTLQRNGLGVIRARMTQKNA
jgi:hypothetical protein